MKFNNSLKIGVLPLDICFLNPEENFSKIENALELLEHGTDLLVLPELFSTAFIAMPEWLWKKPSLTTMTPTQLWAVCWHGPENTMWPYVAAI